uniref:SusD/RagB family nutrient-binding outer membrane lipoprotein n=1 Tax=uncultured Draconibacterium sp. TaxID=1573823 RepID=UPI003217CCAA
MKRIILFISIVTALFIVSCDDDFGDMNRDPKKPTETNYGLQFVGVSSKLPSVGMQQMALRNELLYAYTGLAARTRAVIPIDGVVDRTRGEVWNNYYKFLSNARRLTYDIENYEGELVTTNALAMIKILVSYCTLRTTDVYGDIPYSEAGRSFLPSDAAIFRPTYDDQESIYTHCLEELKWASENLNTNPGDDWMSFNSFDAFYKGDLVKWQKLANSLLLRYAMRISEKDMESAKSYIGYVMSGNKPLIESIEDDFVLIRTSSDMESNRSNIFNAARSCGLRLGEPVWELVSSDIGDETGASIIDPRAKIFFEPDTANVWRAGEVTFNFQSMSPVDYGDDVYSDGRRKEYNYVDENNGPARDNYYAAFNFDMVNGYNVRTPFLTSSEIYFLKAEIYARSEFGISGDVKSSYEEGVRQSCKYWMDVVANDFPNELGTGEDAWKGAPAPTGSDEDLQMIENLLLAHPYNGLHDIYTQKWFSLFWQPEEAFYMMVRTGEPRALTTGSDLYRISYSLDEPVNNLENYNSQLQKMGGTDSPSMKNWWMPN